MKSKFLQTGHWPTLLAAFLYFGLSCMVWVILGSLGIHIAHDLNLGYAQQGMMVATPILAGALLRIVMGVMADRIKPKLAGSLGQLVTIIALGVAWLFGIHNYREILILGVFLGFAGASFAAALPLSSRWYPPEHQGLALGIAGAGNLGTVLSALFAPTLATWYGWNNVFGIILIPVIPVFMVYLAIAKDSPAPSSTKPLSQYLDVLKDIDAWWFMLFYGITFGGFVGLASSLTIYFNDQYHLTPAVAGFYTAACAFAGSMIRPIGGMFADRIGGIKSLKIMFSLAGLSLLFASYGWSETHLALIPFISAMLAFGMGNGAVFQLVPQCFRREIGVITGLIGMAGGIGGFFLASGLGYSKEITGGYRAGFWLFSILAICSLAGLVSVKKRWRATWGHLTTAKV